MNNLKYPKSVIRYGIVETNSSSTHSLAISPNRNLIRRGDPDFNLPIKDNKLYIPTVPIQFGWEWIKYNDCLTKLIYAASLSYRGDGALFNYKSVQKFKSILKNYLNVDDVIFDWDIKFLEYIKQDKIVGCPTDNMDIPSVDHQSFYDSKCQIFENIDTIIGFIFSRESWLFCGNDNGDPPEEYYKELYKYEIKESPDILIRVFFEDKSFPISFIDSTIHYCCLDPYYNCNKFSIIDASNTISGLVEYLWYDQDSKKFNIRGQDNIYPRISLDKLNPTSLDTYASRKELSPTYIYISDNASYLYFGKPNYRIETDEEKEIAINKTLEMDVKCKINLYFNEFKEQ